MYKDNSGKLYFADLVNTFESKITSSKLPNSRSSSSLYSEKPRLVLSTPTKRGRGVQCEENISKIHTDGECPAKRRRCDDNSGGSVLIRKIGGRNPV